MIHQWSETIFYWVRSGLRFRTIINCPNYSRNKKNYPGAATDAAAVAAAAAEFDPNGSMRGKKEQREESMKRLLEVNSH